MLQSVSRRLVCKRCVGRENLSRIKQNLTAGWPIQNCPPWAKSLVRFGLVSIAPRVQVGPETFQDTPPNRRGGPKMGPVMAVQKILYKDSPATEGKSWCPTKPIHTRALCPRDKQDLTRHKNHACVPDAPEAGPHQPGGAAHPTQFVGMVSTG